MNQCQMSNSMLNLYMTCKSTQALGPNKRYAIWVQGCNKRCKGCISPDAQPLDGGDSVAVSELAEEILEVPEIEGITISGGEPFLQQDALCELIDLVRAKRDMGVIVYTGMLYAEVVDTPLAQRCDLIIDGEYIEELNDDRSLRGSSNQNAICVSNRYKRYAERNFGVPGRKTEFVMNGHQINMIGIPAKYLFTGIIKQKNIPLYSFISCPKQMLDEYINKRVLKEAFWQDIDNEDITEYICLGAETVAVINYAAYSSIGSGITIKHFEVLDSYKNQGHGKQIIHQFVNNHSGQIEVLSLWFAHTFWEQCGFSGDLIMKYSYGG